MAGSCWVTAVISGKKVLGNPREIHEVLNAHKLYAAMENLNSYDIDDFLHIAPPAERVVYLMNNLFEWLKKSEEHPLIKSSVFHYEVEFIHPFLDGNGRMGRLWQTLILSKWRETFLYLPVESVIRDRQKDYYDVLSQSDNLGDSTVFIEFMLDSILTAIQEIASDQVTDQVSDQVSSLLSGIGGEKPLPANEIMAKMGLSHRTNFRNHYLRPALDQGFIEMTIHAKPNSSLQKYRLTAKGKSCLAGRGES